MELSSCKDCHELAQALREHVQRVKNLKKELETADIIEKELTKKCEEFEQQVRDVYALLEDEKERVSGLKITLKLVQDRMLYKSQLWEIIEDTLIKE